MAALLTHEIANFDLVVVDVSEATFIDSSVIHNLFRADRLATERGSRLVLQIGTAPIVTNALEISGLLQCLDVAHTRAEAVASKSQGIPESS